MTRKNKIKCKHTDLEGGASILTDENLIAITGATVVTSVFVYIFSCAILQSKYYIAQSLIVFFISVGFIFINYLVADLTKSLSWALLTVFGLISFGILVNNLLYKFALSALAFSGVLSWLIKVGWSKKFIQLELICGLVGVVLIFFQPMTGENIPFDILKRLQTGDISIDALFHASIAAMIKNYLVVSTGMNGLVETPYHVFSHILMAGISSISRTSVVEVYDYSRWIFFGPMLIMAVSASSMQLVRGVKNISFVWLLVSVTLMVYPVLSSAWGGWDQYFTSESYLVGMMLLMTILPTMCKKVLSPNDLVLIILYAGVIALSKASLGIVFSLFILTRLIFSFNGIRDLFLFLGVGLIMLVQFGYRELVTVGTSFKMLSFVEEYTKYGSEILRVTESYGGGIFVTPFIDLCIAFGIFLTFIFMHFIGVWSAVFVALSGHSYKLRSMYLLQIYLILSFGIGLVATLFLNLPGGSVYYISNISFFISMPFLVLFWFIFYKNWPKISSGLLIIFIIYISISEIMKFSERGNSFKILKLKHSAGSTLLSDLRGGLPPNSVIQLVGDENAKNLFNKWKCLPFIFPAVTEYAWVDVIPLWSDCHYAYYSFPYYGISMNQQIPSKPANITSNMHLYRWWGQGDIEEVSN